MTRALTTLCDAEDIGQEESKPTEPITSIPTEPVIPVPATVPASKIQIAIAAAKAANEAKAAKREEFKNKIEAAFIECEPSRDDLEEAADEILKAAIGGEEVSAVAKDLALIISDKQEMIRNVRATIGVVVPDFERSWAEDVENHLRELIGSNAAMREVIRMICEAAGTVRVDELIPVKSDNGTFTVKRRYVDVGDEEPDQDHIVDLKWILPAGIKASARFRRLMADVDNFAKISADASSRLSELQALHSVMSRDYQNSRSRVAELEERVSAYKPLIPNSPTGFFLLAENGKWVAKYEGPRACFTNRWYTTSDQTKAHSFEHKHTAEEILSRLQFARIHRINRGVRNGLRIVTIRYEDQTA